jgi:hypothetical protein
VIRRLLAAATLVALLVAAAVPWWRAERHYLQAPAASWRWLLGAGFDERARLTLGTDYAAWRLAVADAPAGAPLAVLVARDAERLRQLEAGIARGVHEPEEHALRRLHRLRALLAPRRVIGAHELTAPEASRAFLLTAADQTLPDAGAWTKWREVPGFALWRHREGR